MEAGLRFRGGAGTAAETVIGATAPMGRGRGGDGGGVARGVAGSGELPPCWRRHFAAPAGT